MEFQAASPDGSSVCRPVLTGVPQVAMARSGRDVASLPHPAAAGLNEKLEK
jgi:hypothetical protein